jgi:4-hydroxy-4-methyl-2-oxoglutarate aldolase
MDVIAIADALGRLGTSTVYEAAGKIGDMGPAIRQIVPGTRFAGIAVTVRVWPGDTLAVLHAIDAAPPGSVIVVDAGGTDRAAVWGGTSSLSSVARGIRACVTNGSVRDVDEMIELRFPVYAAAVSPRGTLKNHPGWRGIPISVGDCVVNNGDIVIGDSDGVLVVPAGNAAEILTRAEVQDGKQRERDARARGGESLAAIIGLPNA